MKRYLLFVVFIMLCICGFAKEPQRPTSYNYQRGLEALFNDYDTQKALDYLNKELKDNPKCGYTYAWIASIRLNQEEFGRAMTCANSAIKYIPKNDKEYVGWIYSVRAKIYSSLNDTAAAIKDYSQAIKVDPSNYKYYRDRADLYFFTNQLALAEADYQKMLKFNDNEAIIQAYMGIGRNFKEQDKDESAIEYFTKVITLYGDEYSSAYSFRAESELKLKRYEEAVNDIVKALEIDNDNKAYYMLIQLSEPQAIELMQQKLKLQTIFNPNSPVWHYYAGIFAEANKNYKEAIAAYKKANAIGHDKQVDERIASCYEDLGDYKSALHYINYAIDMDSTDANDYYSRANYYAELYQIDKSIEDMSHYIELSPKSSYGYYRRGWWKHLAGLCEEAIEDFNLSKAIDQTYSYTYDGMARCYLRLGDTIKAKAECRKMLLYDTIPNGSSCAYFAYYILGENEKAVEWIEKVLKNDSTQNYDAACVYSLLGDTVKALFYLEKSLKNGFVRFHHLEIDEDLDNIRLLPSYLRLVDEYRQKVLQNIESIPVENSEAQRVVEIPFSKANGVTKVDCTINNLPLNFVFDTGASDVTISQVEANFMFKNGYLSDKDVIGSQRYQTADGNISVGTTINLKQINFGGLELTNVRASVVKSQSAPLLLGQSILQRLGKIEIDNEKRVLKITTR